MLKHSSPLFTIPSPYCFTIMRFSVCGVLPLYVSLFPLVATEDVWNFNHDDNIIRRLHEDTDPVRGKWDNDKLQEFTAEQCRKARLSLEADVGTQ